MYDRKKDPYELNNIYDDNNYSEIREDLHTRLELLRKKYKDSDELNDFYIQKYLDKNKTRNKFLEYPGPLTNLPEYFPVCSPFKST